MRKVPLSLLTTGILLLGGCHHRARQVAVMPPPPVEIRPVMVSVPPPTHPSEPIPTQATTVEDLPPVAEVPKKTPRSSRRTVPPAAAPLPPVQTATVEPPIELGELSAGGDASSSLKQETYSLIHALDARVAILPAAVTSGHRREVERAKRFLKQAEDSWNTADVEGAHTLAIKAKVLLDDLQK